VVTLGLLAGTRFFLPAATAAPSGSSVVRASASSGGKAAVNSSASSTGSKTSPLSASSKPVPAKPDKLVDGYLIRQNSQAGGRFEVTVSPQGVKIGSHAGIDYLFRTKENVAILCNHGSKVYWSGPIAKWKPPMQKASYFRRSTYGDMKIEKSESETFMNVAATKQLFKAKQVFQPKARMTPDEKAELVSAEIITSTALVDDLKPLSEALSLVYAVPVADGLPLQAVYTNRKGTTRYDLKTLELTKTKVKPSEFVAPSGYKRMEKIEDAYTGSSDSVKQMLEELGGSNSL
jgi:hypothetical protein